MAARRLSTLNGRLPDGRLNAILGWATILDRHVLPLAKAEQA